MARDDPRINRILFNKRGSIKKWQKRGAWTWWYEDDYLAMS